MFHYHELVDTPDLLALHKYKPDCFPYLLASNTSGEVNTRYSLLMAYPDEPHVQRSQKEDILVKIDTQLNDNADQSELPFIGGWFVYLGFEYGSLIEPSVPFQLSSQELPLAFISRIPAAIIVDHAHNCGYLVAIESRPELIDRIMEDIDKCSPYQKTGLPNCDIKEEEPVLYRNNLRRIKQYIKDGDIFQANLSRLWQVNFRQPCDPVSVYASLSSANPAPFASLVKFQDHYIISSSPERLVSVNNGIVETRPIAGTYPRGETTQQDEQLSAQLLGHPKERAEHVMLIDLERNDLGRVCQPGSIRVREQMFLESYQHVHHIVSSITGKLEAGKSVKDVIHAVFPGGTITGCPKVRCMQIICEMEQAARGAYTGSIGYVSDHGTMDMNILIRTMTMHKNRVTFRAGAGIVNDSIVEQELHETRHKARGMIRAFQPDH